MAAWEQRSSRPPGLLRPRDHNSPGRCGRRSNNDRNRLEEADRSGPGIPMEAWDFGEEKRSKGPKFARLLWGPLSKTRTSSRPNLPVGGGSGPGIPLEAWDFGALRGSKGPKSARLLWAPPTTTTLQQDRAADRICLEEADPDPGSLRRSELHPQPFLRQIPRASACGVIGYRRQQLQLFYVSTQCSS